MSRAIPAAGSGPSLDAPIRREKGRQTPHATPLERSRIFPTESPGPAGPRDCRSTAELGITPSEASLFNVVHFGLTVGPSDLCRGAAFSDYCFCGLMTAEENQAAPPCRSASDSRLHRARRHCRGRSRPSRSIKQPVVGLVQVARLLRLIGFRQRHTKFISGHHASLTVCVVSFF